MNKIGDYDYYRSQGFAEDELWMARKTDCMFNNWEYLTDKQKKRYYIMIKKLEL